MKTLLKGCVALVGVVLLTLPEAAYACEKCLGMGGANEATIDAIVMSMASLFGMVTFVFGGIGMFFVNMRKRARMLEPGELIITEYGDLQATLPTESGR